MGGVGEEEKGWGCRGVVCEKFLTESSILVSQHNMQTGNTSLGGVTFNIQDIQRGEFFLFLAEQTRRFVR